MKSEYCPFPLGKLARLTKTGRGWDGVNYKSKNRSKYYLDKTISTNTESKIVTRYLFLFAPLASLIKPTIISLSLSDFSKSKSSQLLMVICNSRDFENNFFIAFKKFEFKSLYL